MSSLFRERLMHLPLISFLTELWHLLDVRAMAAHGAVLAALLSAMCYLKTLSNSSEFDQLPWQLNVELAQIYLLRSHKGYEAETFKKCP